MIKRDAFAIGGILISTGPLGVIASLQMAVWASGGVAARLGLERSIVRGIAESSAWAGLAGARLGFEIMNWQAYRWPGVAEHAFSWGKTAFLLLFRQGDLSRASLQKRTE